MAETEKQIVSMYGGTVQLAFYPKSHMYKIDGKSVPSVTKILSQLDKPRMMHRVAAEIRNAALLIPVEHRTDDKILEACNAHNVKADKAKDVWSKIHERIEKWIVNSGQPMPEDEQVANGVIAFLQRVREHNVSFLQSERKVYSKKHNYVWQFDAVAAIDHSIVLIDFKSSKNFYAAEYALQMAAYRQAYEEETGVSINKVMWMWFGKDTWWFRCYDVTELYERALEIFNLLVQLQHLKSPYDKMVKDRFTS